ncbi:MAG TPA: cytochrome b/b6 domain-containing protein [Burkholderiales bacterium]|nr:cytochrome b/b6 domain-containing protein [Burkholderiales bacterium]
MSGGQPIKVWDLGVRLFHWTLVLAYAVAYLSGEVESDRLHIIAGYAVLALIAFRLVWGFVGTRHARFVDFVYGPAATWRYARSMLRRAPLHYLGHNPLGGWMVVALLLSLAAACWSGLEAYGAQGHGPLAQAGLVAPAYAHGDGGRDADDDEAREAEGDEFWEELHELFSHLTLLLVALHIAGAVAASLLHGENLVKAMITGYKRPHGPQT